MNFFGIRRGRKNFSCFGISGAPGLSGRLCATKGKNAVSSSKTVAKAPSFKKPQEEFAGNIGEIIDIDSHKKQEFADLAENNIDKGLNEYGELFINFLLTNGSFLIEQKKDQEYFIRHICFNVAKNKREGFFLKFIKLFENCPEKMDIWAQDMIASKGSLKVKLVFVNLFKKYKISSWAYDTLKKDDNPELQSVLETIEVYQVDNIKK